MRTVHEFSAGGVALTGDPVRVALIRVGQRWVLPKGLVEKGEDPEVAALREVREETGFDAEVEGPAGDVEYWFVWSGTRRHKKVTFFRMTITGGRADDHDHEVDEVRLVDPAEAQQMLAFDNERKVLLPALAAGGAGGSSSGARGDRGQREE